MVRLVMTKNDEKIHNDEKKTGTEQMMIMTPFFFSGTEQMQIISG